MRRTGFTLVRSLLLSTSCLSLFAVSSLPAHSQPTGGTVTAGQASINNISATSTIIKQTSDKALINWQAFSIAAGGTVQFSQPNSNSITLNRVIGTGASTINGSLLANGQVWLINANGILFGSGSTINVAGLLATTSDIADADFMSGNYNFSNGSGASVVNQGNIRTQSGGSAVLSAARVVNQGLIEADSGTVVLGGASAFTVDFDGDNLLRYAIGAPAGQAADGQTGVVNSGTIAANGGRVIMTARAAATVTDSVVNNTGMIEATSAHVQNGEVVLDAGNGTVNVGGSINASGTAPGETGGTVSITGATVNVADNTQIDVSGDAGGGTVNIGGAAHGGSALQAANNTTVGNATIKADAVNSGNGGSLVVWSNGITDFSGIFSATGGGASGNGGNIETSGATLHIAPSAKVNTTAANGTAGNWLLDPLNIVIANGGGTSLSGGTLAIGTDPGLTDTIAPSTITSALATTNVTLEASNDITVTNGFSYSSTFSLNLLAMHNITVNDNIQNTLASGGGALNLVAGWDGTTLNPAQFGNSGVYGNNSGSFSIVGTASGVAIGARSGAANLYADNVTLDATNGYAQLGYHGAGGGAILVRALGNLTITAGAGASDFAMIGNGSTLGDVVGSITGNIDIRTTGNSVLSGGSGSGNIPWIGNVATSPDTETGNVTFVTASISEQGGDFGQNVAVDVVGGDVTIGITNPNQVDTINHTITYDSPHTVNVLTAGSFEIDSPLQNTGSGAINFVTGWDGTTLDPAHFGDAGVYGNNAKSFVIGGNNANGDVAFGSAAGATSVYAANVSILAVNGYAQFGYHGAGGGSISVNTVGDVVVEANPFVAEIGNGGTDVAANSGGTITVNAGGNVTVDEVSQGATLGIATIGSLGGGGSSSQSGNISVTAGALTVESEAGFAFIGNASAVSTTGGATGTIAINASSVDIETVGLGFRAAIGDGARRLNQGTTGGDINLTSGTLDLIGSSDPSAGGQARIGSFGAGLVVGNINITTTSDINLIAPSGELASIGNGENGASTTSGNISVQSGGAITLAALGNGVARISAGLAPNSNINVIAAGDVTLLTTADEFTTTGAQAFIGSFANGLDAVAGNVTISSTNGGVNLFATEDMSFVIVGNQAGAPTIGGTLTINAPKGTLSLLASGTGAQVTIGNDGSTGDAGGNINVSTAGVSLSASGNTSQVQIGNGGPFMIGNASGSITVTDSGSLDVMADGSGAFAQIGNGDPLHTGTSNGSVGGDINLQVAGSSTLGGIAGTPWVGNLADGTGVESGNVVWVTHTLDGGVAFQTLIASDLSGGDFTLGITNPTDTNNINNGFVYNSPHNLTLLSAGSINIQSTIENNGSGALTLVAGWNPSVAPANVATTAGAYGNNNQSITIGGASGVGNVSFGSAAGAVTILSYDVTIDGANGYAQLGYHGSGGGTINLTATHDLSMTTSSGYAMIGNGSLNGDVNGNVGGDITIQVGGVVHDNDSVGNPIFFGNATASGTESGNLVMVMSSEDGTSNDALGNSARTDLAGGDVTLGFTSTTNPTGPRHNYAVNTLHTLNLLSAGDLVIAGSVQNSGTGAINLVAGWDGHTLAPASFGIAGVYGNNGGAVLIGGVHATSNVAIGSAGGTTSVFAASLSLSATNGYAQLGIDGSGTGAIFVTVTGGVTITGGSSAGQFAQIGNGGLNTSGNNGGDIGITAGGDLTLSGGAGTNTYAQVGHGGAQSNSNSAGYSNVAPITITAANVVLDSGSGGASYVQIGNGGFKSGAGLASGTATNGGDITITSAHAVTLLANGADAYAQIGNGGDQSNLNPAAVAGGVDSGDIVVHAPSGVAGAVTLTAGAGSNAYAQIGNGGYSANAGVNATAVNFTMLGSVSVTDLSLAGGNTSANSYAQIGNGDAALASYGDASGDIVISANGTITYTNGSAPHSPAVIGNFTGQGTSTGTVTGATPPPSTIINDPGVVGVIVTLVSNPFNNPANNPNNSLLNGSITLVETEVVPLVAETAAGAAGVGLTVTTEGPIASLSGEGGDTPNVSDSATVVIADSLNGADKPSTTKSLIGGLLTQLTPVAAGQTIHGIPPADQDFSSWGNEALWQ